MKEKDFKNIMQNSKLEIQFSDFEDNVMEQIQAKESSRRSVWSNLKLSWIFFFIGAFFGIFATQFLVDFQMPFFGENSKLIVFVGEILVVFVVASQFDNLIRFTLKKRE
ncbi:MAG: hypothetical protein HN778_08550 [Prolixibacteraceae bacterium]|jgi:hypothetical protein|nr:hypothetical protein [Prolixibacteraceae bacterium]MBT6006985.1 hypothetical protein [Prolixibacteraceae bacterium]MBT6765890.1 hypothetical protein [Prolixibacteraceae bacterium]MBT7000760.1 hypothetical protein [Prolixibacteraceae bacterium]MBT7394864.1 hypothetical protein [Prolixibacteraceae bacterium]